MITFWHLYQHSFKILYHTCSLSFFHLCSALLHSYLTARVLSFSHGSDFGLEETDSSGHCIKRRGIKSIPILGQLRGSLSTTTWFKYYILVNCKIKSVSVCVHVWCQIQTTHTRVYMYCNISISTCTYIHRSTCIIPKEDHITFNPCVSLRSPDCQSKIICIPFISTA